MVIQWIIVAIVVAASAAYLGRIAWRMVRGTKPVCGCSGCPASKDSASPLRR